MCNLTMYFLKLPSTVHHSNSYWVKQCYYSHFQFNFLIVLRYPDHILTVWTVNLLLWVGLSGKEQDICESQGW